MKNNIIKSITLFFMCVFCFKKAYSFRNEKPPVALNQKITASKWPYLGSTVPSYLAITGGIETISSHYYFVGLAYSFTGLTINPPIGAFAGFRLYYKQNMNDRTNYSYESDLCLMGGITLGVNYNYNKTGSNTIHGVKPFVGFSAYHVQIYYGYNFYKNSLDTEKQLTHHKFTMSINIPTFKLDSKKKKKD